MRNLKERLRNGERLLGTMLTLFINPELAKVLKQTPLDYVMLDCEHSAFSFAQCSAFLAVSRSVELPVIVRIPELRREHVLKYLEAGADGLMLPNAQTKEQAERLVRYAKYAPMGERGVSFSRPHTDYQKVDKHAYMRYANETTVLLCQIESQKGVENAKEIAAVSGIDLLFVGPNDLSQDYGMLGDYANPVIVDAFTRIADAAAGAGKHAGIHFGEIGALLPWLSKGMRMNLWGSDVSLLMNGIAADFARLPPDGPAKGL